MHKIKYLLVITIFTFFVRYSTAQEFKVTSDLGLWTEITLSKEILNDFTLSTNQHLRLNRNFKNLDDWITEIGLEYKIDKNFALGADARYNKNYHYNEPAQNDYRYNFDLNYDGRIATNFKIYYRIRYQKEFYGNSVFNEYLDYFESTFRHQFKLKFDKNDRSKIYGSAEIFRQTKKAGKATFNKYRVWIGDEITLFSEVLNLAFGYEHQLNNANPYTYYLVRIKYEISL